ncbi:isopeptide-forming domain-containing fimbrial protein [Nostoc sp. 'Peltigera malacea cyanobiont' DB3992]|uniref:isopeptide-forming domain-containing fimbrial protein n=1 Tax=Nostoc sp. 'Peltigera malacea cyanobiont' DB3992 TaxID=1206980 RepID=UPI00211F36FD|nr:isopeptide-forming domain-containing fimbrial protein [Nostoc sp. 'Peltigera malacea cyanobiont' DB3992]
MQRRFPTVPTSFKFTGGNGGSGNQTSVGVGGNFSFNAASTGSYQIIIDTNNDGIFDPSSDRVLQNVLAIGSNVVLWDGKDASGTNLQPLAGNAPYNAIITTRSGEYHFPMLDAENNPLGFKITMENPPAAFPTLADQNGQQIGSTTVYYNDNNYTTANGTAINLDGTGATNPRNAARGINSVSGEHEFSSNYGDFKGIDTWTYFPSQAILTPLVITTNTQANVIGKKSVRFLADNDSSGTVTVGDRIEYTITYSNLNPGNSDAINFVINDSLPSQLTFVSAAISAATSGNNITINPSYNGAGVVAVTNSGTLRVGETITIKITGTINNANGGNPISNQANATFNTPDNPTGTVGTVFTDADSAGATNNPPTLGNSFLQITDNGVNTGNNPASTADDDPTLFTVLNTINSNPKLLLIKRITRLNNQDLTDIVDGRSDVATNASNYVPEPYATDDSDPKWPVGYLRGLINAGTVKPGDELEYTIYFLSNGLGNATNVKFCDLVPTNVSLIPTTFNGMTPNDGGLPGADRGISLAIGSPTPTLYLTNVGDSDRGYFYTANDSSTPSYCGTNTNGAVVVNITVPSFPNLPAATGSGTPANSYGFVRFRAKVK